jgi:cell division protease FtsH
MGKTPFEKMLARIEDDKEASEAAKCPIDPDTMVPRPETIEQAVAAIRDFLDANGSVYALMDRLEKLLPDQEPKKKRLTDDEFIAQFLTGKRFGETFTAAISLSPVSIGLIALDSFFKDLERFEIFDPTKLPYREEMRVPYDAGSPTHTLIEMCGKQVSVPISNQLFLEDKKNSVRFIVTYKPQQSGGLSLQIEADDDKSNEAMGLASELKLVVLASPYIRGQIIEITGGSEFRVVDIGEQPAPVFEASLQAELEKNIISLFDRAEEFEKYGLPIKRSIILAGPPGTGKTLIERWLASKVRGKVTTIWVTAKSIDRPSEVADVFDIARKLTPSLVIMEDLDLIAGTRSAHFAGNCLGEMLNQLDGLKSNDALVLLASTNSVSSLDDALKDRPGRIDRIYEVGRPPTAVAIKIATDFMRKSKIPDSIVESMDLAPFFPDRQFTGAQIVEIIKGGIFESIHRQCDINELCIKASKDGLEKQRLLLNKQ